MREIVTDRLRLRPINRQDLAAMHELYSDARTMRFAATPPHSNLAQTEAWLDLRLELLPSEGEDLAVDLSDRVIGRIGFLRFPEIGFIFRPSCWGHGYAREALEAVIARAFQVHGLEQVNATVDTLNIASLTLLHKVGFVEVGRAYKTVRLDHSWRDSAYLRLTRDGWNMRSRRQRQNNGIESRSEEQKR